MNLAEVMEPVAASGMFANAWWMVAAPLVVAAILLLAGRVADAWGHWLAVAAVWFSFAVAANRVSTGWATRRSGICRE